MADNLPEPKSRTESYLAKAAGMETTLPEKPESRLELYLDAIAEGGGGGITVVQTTGQSTTSVMSQKAVTDQVGGLALLAISQADYDNLGTKDPDTLYIITGA